MHVVVSQAWSLDPDAHADAYIALSAELVALIRAHPGFHERLLLRSSDDPTHFTNIRRFSSAEAYREIAHLPGYAQLIERMGQHLDLSRYAGRAIKELMTVAAEERA